MKTFMLLEIDHDDEKLSANKAMSMAEDRAFRMDGVKDTTGRPIPAQLAEMLITRHKLTTITPEFLQSERAAP